jgi:hypothetical protein
VSGENRGPGDHVGELRVPDGHLVQPLDRHGEHLAGPPHHRRDERGLADHERQLTEEPSRAVHPEPPFVAGPVPVDDLDETVRDHEEGRRVLPLPDQHLALRGGPALAVPVQLRDVGVGEPGIGPTEVGRLGEGVRCGHQTNASST